MASPPPDVATVTTRFCPRRSRRPDAQRSAGDSLLLDAGFTFGSGSDRHERAGAGARLRGVVRRIPAMPLLAWRLAWREDRCALLWEVSAEVGRGRCGVVEQVPRTLRDQRARALKHPGSESACGNRRAPGRRWRRPGARSGF
ncbi:hypothetical protein GCM10010430_04680 [Kitasatospora cystarginea]|uniref:Uncharacterized protein n=1 Tax=Kitasatospora cystarginea TaxID=58350 RepID=A0ABN3DEW0_9ACTN